MVALAKDKGVTATQLTLAWPLAQGDDIIPIPGTTKAEKVEENLQALKFALTKEEEQKIRKTSEEAEVHGGRYSEAFASALYADTVEE
jgi:aryl-alcohol dehydrogenase-like predicted oxidoreductase